MLVYCYQFVAKAISKIHMKLGLGFFQSLTKSILPSQYIQIILTVQYIEYIKKEYCYIHYYNSQNVALYPTKYKEK